MHKQKGFAPLLILFIIILLAGGGYAAYRKVAAPRPSSLPAGAPTSSVAGGAPEAARSPEGMLQGFWKPEQSFVYDRVSGQFRQTSTPNAAYIEFKGNLTCPGGSIDAQGKPLPCRQYAPFTIEGGMLAVQVSGQQSIKASFAFIGDKLEIVVEPPPGGPGERIKTISAKWAGAVVATPAPSPVVATPFVPPVPSGMPIKTPAPTASVQAPPPTPVMSPAASPVSNLTPLAKGLVTAQDLSSACGGSFADLFPASYRQGEQKYYFERKEPYLTLQIYATVFDLREGMREFAWQTAQLQYSSETNREPPYIITQRNFAGDDSALIPDAGVGAKAVVRKGDFLLKFEDYQRSCQTAGCTPPTCADGFPNLARTIVGRLNASP